MTDIEKHAEAFDVKNIVITLILSSIGFLTALTWRDAIKETITEIIPAGEGLIYSYYAAILVTIAAVVITYILIKIRKTNIIPDKYEQAFAKQTVGRAKHVAKHGSPLHIRKRLGIKKKGNK